MKPTREAGLLRNFKLNPILLSVVSVVRTHRQVSSDKPDTWPNSSSFAVTNVSSRTSAWLAINKS